MVLVESDNDNQLHVNMDTLALVTDLDKQLCIVCIAGEYRSGKSYLMNQLIGKGTGEYLN